MIVDKIIPGGQSLCTDESGKKFLFWNALPGESVEEFTLTKNKSRYAEAIATKISNPSPHRVNPVDSCFLSTSPWQIMDYDYELAVKQSLVVEIFREHHIEIPSPEIYTDRQDYHYRNKMEYALYWDNSTASISLAFHTRGSHHKIPITFSSIERPEIFATASNIVAELNTKHLEARQFQSLILRTNQRGQVSGGLLENGRPHPRFPELTDEVFGHQYVYSPNGFFQINLPVYELALSAIRPLIATDQVLDLYSGVGTIGLSVARGKHLTLVESDPSAYRELEKNVATMPSDEFSSLRPVLAKSEDVLSRIAPGQTVILDPPRAGCDSRLLARLLDVRPTSIIYLSCNPATQARDLESLLTLYRLVSVQTFNFFPRTPHIENLVTLSL